MFIFLGNTMNTTMRAAHLFRIVLILVLSLLSVQSAIGGEGVDRFIGVWSGLRDNGFIAIQRDRIDWGACAGMSYRLVAQKADYFYLKVEGYRMCMGNEDEGMFLVLNPLDSGKAMWIQKCGTEKDLQKLIENPKDGGVYCSQWLSTRGVMSLEAASAFSTDLVREGGCDNKHPQQLTKQQVALYRALNLNQVSVVGEILSESVNVNFFGPGGWTPLGIAVRQGDLDIIKALLKAGAKPDVASCGHYDITIFIPSIRISRSVHDEIAKTILDARANTQQNSLTH